MVAKGNSLGAKKRLGECVGGQKGSQLIGEVKIGRSKTGKAQKATKLLFGWWGIPGEGNGGWHEQSRILKIPQEKGEKEEKKGRGKKKKKGVPPGGQIRAGGQKSEGDKHSLVKRRGGWLKKKGGKGEKRAEFVPHLYGRGMRRDAVRNGCM